LSSALTLAEKRHTRHTASGTVFTMDLFNIGSVYYRLTLAPS
jgi:hypothetical protein